MSHESLPPELLQRKAVVYVRQASIRQMHTTSGDQGNELAGVAQRHGFTDIEVIDDDMGLSGSGSAERSGIDHLLADVCAGEVGAVLCSSLSQLTRNVHKWHLLLETCRITKTLIVVSGVVYDPSWREDRLLLGVNDCISEAEIEIIRARARAGEDRIRRGGVR